MTVYVLMLNDFPLGVYATEDGAARARETHKQYMARVSGILARVERHYRIHFFTIDAEPIL